MRVAQKFAGYSLAEADNLRKACGKKIRELMAKERAKFVDGLRGHRLRRDARHASCSTSSSSSPTTPSTRATAYGYGLIAYQTAYLKANYPVEYLAALLTSVKTNLDKAAVYLTECRTMGIEVLVPDVNRSESRLRRRPRLDDGTEVIPFGLSAVRNVGEGLVGLIVAEREANGPFADFYDFCERVDTTVLNKRTIESLIKAGGVRLARPPPPGPARGVRADRRPAPSPRRKERDRASCRLFGDAARTTARRLRRAARTIPDLEFDKKRAAGLREGDARPLRVATTRSWAPRRRCAAAPTCTIAELAERRGRRRCAPSAASSPACSASGPRRATSWPSSSSRTSRPRSRSWSSPRRCPTRPQARRRRRGHRQGPRRQAATTSPS